MSTMVLGGLSVFKIGHKMDGYISKYKIMTIIIINCNINITCKYKQNYHITCDNAFNI